MNPIHRVELDFNTHSTPSISPKGKHIPFGVRGSYLKLTPDAACWLRICRPGQHVGKDYIPVRVGEDVKVHLHVRDATDKLGWSRKELMSALENMDWPERLKERIVEVKRYHRHFQKLRRGADRSSREYSIKNIGKIWKAGLNQEEMMEIVRDADDLKPDRSKEFCTQAHKYIYFRTKGDSLRVYKKESVILARDRGEVSQGTEICSVSQQVLKIVPIQNKDAVTCLKNGHKMLSALHADGDARGIQALATKPIVLNTEDGDYLTHYCKLYNRHDLFDLTTRSDSDWWDLPMQEKLRLCGELLHGLAFVHKERINPETGRKDRMRHGDLKVDNVFVEEDGEWKPFIGDFDGARWLSDIHRELPQRREWLCESDLYIEEDCPAMYGVYTMSCLNRRDAEEQRGMLIKENYDAFVEAELARDVWQMAETIIESLTGQIFGVSFADYEEPRPLEVNAQTVADVKACLLEKGVPITIVDVLMNMYSPDWIGRHEAAMAAKIWDAAMSIAYR